MEPIASQCRGARRNLRRTHAEPMLDIRLIREQTDFVKAELGKAGVEAAEIDRVVECDAERRHLQHELDELRARRTRESKELGRMVPEEREPRRLEMRALGDQIAESEQRLPRGGGGVHAPELRRP